MLSMLADYWFPPPDFQNSAISLQPHSAPSHRHSLCAAPLTRLRACHSLCSCFLALPAQPCLQHLGRKRRLHLLSAPGQGCMVQLDLSFSSCRIHLEGEERERDGIPLGIVGRLYVTQHSQPAVRHAFASFEPRRVSLLALGLQQVANQRGPDALVGVIPGESPHSTRMRELAVSCYEAKECLVSSSGAGDVVLVPRSPACAEEDGFSFLVFVTSLRCADVCDIVRHQRKVVVVLDLDNTLVDAAAVAVTQKDWDALHWQPCSVTTESGRELCAQYAMLMEHDPHADAIYIMHWRLGRLCCTFKVRIRRGWERFRDFLVRERSKYEVFVCSKGKQEYVQLLWHMLDPYSQLFPSTDWDWRLNSTFPDAVPRAVNKTLLSALGCAHPLDEAPPMQLACPVMCLDDCPKAYVEDYIPSVMYVEEYRPSDLYTADKGSVLRQAEERLEEYWAANYAPQADSPGGAAMDGQQGGEQEEGSEAEGPWPRVVDAVIDVMQDQLGQPVQSAVDGLEDAHARCTQLGAWLAQTTTVRGVFGDQTYIGDAAEVVTPELLSPTCVSPPSSLPVVALDTKAAPHLAADDGAVVGPEAEAAGEAAAAAEGQDGPMDMSLLPEARAGADEPFEQFGGVPAVLCALCAPAGSSLPGCLACAELAAAAKAADAMAVGGEVEALLNNSAGLLEGAAGAALAAVDMAVLASGGEEEDPDQVSSSGGWCSSACSTPRSTAGGAAAARTPRSAGLGKLAGGLGDEAGDLGAAGPGEEEDEEEREAAAADVFTCVEPSLQQAAREVFHMRLARISGRSLVMVPNARSLSGMLEAGTLSLSSSPR